MSRSMWDADAQHTLDVVLRAHSDALDTVEILLNADLNALDTYTTSCALCRKHIHQV